MTGGDPSVSDTDPEWTSSADLFVCLASTLLFVVVQSLGGVADRPVFVSVQLLFLLSVPGYAFVSAVFPKRVTEVHGDPYNAETASTSSGENALGLPERGVLSVGFSLPVVVLGGIVLDVSRWGVSSPSVVTVVAATTVLLLAVAGFRRRRTPTAERFGIGTSRLQAIRWVGTARSDPTMETVFNVLIVVGVTLTLLVFTFGLVTSHSDERFTEFYVLAENGNGGLVAGNYSTEYVRGEPQQVHLGIGNREGEDERYRVAIALQEFNTENGTAKPVNERFLKNISVNVARGKRRIVETRVTPHLSGTNVRLEFLLYRGSLPREPSADTAYREVHYWVNVSPSRTIQASRPVKPTVRDG